MEIQRIPHGGSRFFSRLFAAAAAQSRPVDETALDALCAALTGLPGDGPAMRRVLDGIALPAGFLHTRLFDAATGEEFCGTIGNASARTTAAELAETIAVDVRVRGARWTATAWAPVVDPGVLDLVVTLEPAA